MLDEAAWTEYINLDDPAIKSALRVFKNNAAFPKKPQKKNNGKTAYNMCPIYDHTIRRNIKTVHA